jgi:hypothetical protein
LICERCRSFQAVVLDGSIGLDVVDQVLEYLRAQNIAVRKVIVLLPEDRWSESPRYTGCVVAVQPVDPAWLAEALICGPASGERKEGRKHGQD